jgi:ribose transport system ATP-binding protein
VEGLSTGGVELPRQPDGDAPFRCIGLHKRFDSVTALRNLTFSANLGEIHAILGENGAGKSTFVKILGGTLRPDAGNVSLLGEDVRFSNPRTAMAHGISVAFQELSLASELTVAQNIWLRHARVNRLGILSRRDLNRRTQELMRAWDAPDISAGEKVRNLSIGERQVVEILKSLAVDARVLVFDEATAALPAAEATWALGVARKVAAAGSVVFFISHRIREIREVADRVTILRSGEAVVSAAIGDVSDDAMIEAMLGQKPKAIYPGALSEPNESVVPVAVRDLRGGRLRGVSFDLQEGEILGVGGLQGQGQTDLLLALFGMIRSRGDVMVRGRKLRARSPRHALTAGIALVPEDRRLQGLLMTKTIRENVSLPNLRHISNGGFLSPWAELRMADRAVALLNVRATSPEQRVATLSGGNQQKVVVAKLLLVDASVVLLDDFTRGIDVGTKAELFQLLRSLTAQGKSIVFFSSEAQELIEMCDRVLVLREGKIAAVLSGELKSEDRLMRAAFGLSEAEGVPS